MKLSYKDNYKSIERIKKLVVSINVYDDNQEEIEQGTGFFIDKTHIITANHVIDDGNEVGFYVKINHYFKNELRCFNAKIVYSSIQFDFGILEIEECNCDLDDEFIKLTVKGYFKNDFTYMAYGFPSSNPNGHLQIGKLNDFEKDCNNRDIFKLTLGDSKLNDYRGYSGSPVICNGQLMGMAIEQSSGLGVAQNINILSFSTISGIINRAWCCKDTFIEEIMNIFTENAIAEVERNKHNGKYIPEIFVELGTIKEYLRGFCDPTLFFKKHLDYSRQHKFSKHSKLLERYGLEGIKIEDYDQEILLSNVKEIASMMSNCLNDMKNYTSKLVRDVDLRKQIPEEYIDLFDTQFYSHRFYGLEREVERRLRLFKSFQNNQIILTEKAGQGKTNLLCDFVENFLIKKSIPILFIAARSVNGEDIRETITDCIPYNMEFDELLDIINFYCTEEDVQFIFVIDAINEQKNVIDTKRYIYEFLNDISRFTNIKAILTARTEYFTEKFGDVLEKCPQVEIIESYNWHSQEQKLRQRVYKGYLEHFNISINDIGNEIYDQLTADFLLLRMFSEAYRGDNIPSLQHLFRYEIFERYYNYKKSNLIAWDYLHGNIDATSTYENIINTVTENMIEQKKFSNIDRSIIVGNVRNDLLIKLIDEDIIFREDIIKGLMNTKVEVINFTFDEFRDFCIAKKIMELFVEEEPEASIKLIDELTVNEFESSEGIQKYLFFAGMKYQNQAFSEVLYRQKWYIQVYLENILSVDEEYIKKEDIKRLKRILTDMSIIKENYFLIGGMYSDLIKRYNIDVYKKLNIRYLVEIFEEINDLDFRSYIHDMFRHSDIRDNYWDRKDRIHIDKVVERMKIWYPLSYNKGIIVFLSYMDSRGFYIDEFFDWCMNNHGEQLISTFENIINGNDEIEKKAIKHIIRDITYYDFNLIYDLKIRWQSLIELVDNEIRKKSKTSNMTKEQMMDQINGLLRKYRGEED